MIKEILYTYLGTNGVITSPIHLEGIYYVRKVRLRADPKKVLTKDFKKYHTIIIVPEDEVDNWYEIDDPIGIN